MTINDVQSKRISSSLATQRIPEGVVTKIIADLKVGKPVEVPDQFLSAVKQAFTELGTEAPEYGSLMSQLNGRVDSLGYEVVDPSGLQGEAIFDHWAKVTAHKLRGLGVEMTCHERGRLRGMGDIRVMQVDLSFPPPLGRVSLSMTPSDITNQFKEGKSGSHLVAIDQEAIRQAFANWESNVQSLVARPEVAKLFAQAIEAHLGNLVLHGSAPAVGVDLDHEEGIRSVFGNYTHLATQHIFKNTGYSLDVDLWALTRKVSKETQGDEVLSKAVYAQIEGYCTEHGYSEFFQTELKPTWLEARQ